MISPLRNRLATLTVAALAPICLLSIACGPSGPEMARVSGKVTYKGEPVPKGTVAFQAVDPNGRNATGEIQSDGTYTLQTEEPGDGAQVGDYRVAISAREDEILDYTPKVPVKPKRLVPARYEAPTTSELKATVKSGSNTIDFPLD